MALVIGLFAGSNLDVQAESGNWQIVFDGNGADGGSTAPITGIKNGEEYYLPDCGFTKTNKEFLKWNTEPDGSGMEQLAEQCHLGQD